MRELTQNRALGLLLMLTPIVLLGTYCLFLAVTGPASAAERWLYENGPVETLTFAAFIWSALRSFVLFRQLRSSEPNAFSALYIVVGIGAFVIGMEEISWGQQFLHFDTPQWLQDRNVQNELTLHNLGNHNSAADLIAFGAIGALAVLGSIWPALRGIAPSPLLLTWFLTIGVFGVIDVYNDYVPLGPKIDDVIEWVGELVELLAGASLVLTLELQVMRRRHSTT